MQPGVCTFDDQTDFSKATAIGVTVSRVDEESTAHGKPTSAVTRYFCRPKARLMFRRSRQQGCVKGLTTPTKSS